MTNIILLINDHLIYDALNSFIITICYNTLFDRKFKEYTIKLNKIEKRGDYIITNIISNISTINTIAVEIIYEGRAYNFFYNVNSVCQTIIVDIKQGFNQPLVIINKKYADRMTIKDVDTCCTIL